MCRVRKTPKFAVVIPTLLVLLGCGQESDESPGSYEIAVILLQEDQFFRLIEAGAKKGRRGDLGSNCRSTTRTAGSIAKWSWSRPMWPKVSTPFWWPQSVRRLQFQCSRMLRN